MLPQSHTVVRCIYLSIRRALLSSYHIRTDGKGKGRRKKEKGKGKRKEKIGRQPANPPTPASQLTACRTMIQDHMWIPSNYAPKCAPQRSADHGSFLRCCAVLCSVVLYMPIEFSSIARLRIFGCLFISLRGGVVVGGETAAERVAGESRQAF